MEEMTLNELIKSGRICEVYDDVSNDMGFTFHGPLELTDEGINHFSDIMELNVRITPNDEAFVEVDDTDESAWQKTFEKVQELFYTSAVCRGKEAYNRWFKN